MTLQTLFGAVSVLASVAAASIYPEASLVNVVDADGFKQALGENRTSMIAFVGKDCSTCAEFGGEFSRAALGLYPYIPMYSLDCDSKANKKLCIEQGVSEFPAVKIFPRGDSLPALEYDSTKEKSASGFYHWGSLSIPHGVKKYQTVDDVRAWAVENVDKPRAMLLNTSPKIPLLWQTVANEFNDDVVFGSHRDRRGRSSKELGLKPGNGKDARILLYPVGQRDPVLFEGIQKLDSLTPAIKALIAREALDEVLEEAKSEEFVPDERELEIQKQQEFEKMRLAHGGFSDMAEFEEAVKNGGGANYHGSHGYPGMMGGAHHAHAGHHGAGAQGAHPGPTDAPLVVQEGGGQQAVFNAEKGGKSKMPRTESPAATKLGESETAPTHAAHDSVFTNSKSEL